MAVFRKSIVAIAISIATRVAGHGHVDWIVANGVAYRGYDSPGFSYEANPPKVIGWTIDQKDNGFVEPNNFGTADIICHRSATPAPGHATVKAGDTLSLQWNTWPESHKGPVIDYLAKCPGTCETVDKTQLNFFKIGAGSFIDMSLPNGGKWAADVLLANKFSWNVQIPANLAPGNYVLRHEIIALHSGGQPNGAQAYPQCINIEVTGGGSLSPAGVKGTSLYKASDPGILFNLYTSPISYPMPGPTLVAGLPSTVAQGFKSATVTSSATIPGGSGGGSPVTTGASPTTTSGSGGTGGTAPKYGQCGGQDWKGATTCVTGTTCQVLNQYYSQCA